MTVTTEASTVPSYRREHIDDAVSVGARLRELRLERGMSQRDLAFPGCTAVYICRIERGERVPSLQIIRRLAERLQTTPEYLARGGATRAPFAVEIDAAALDAFICLCDFREHGELVTLDGLTAEELERLRILLRAQIQPLAGPIAASIIARRHEAVGLA